MCNYGFANVLLSLPQRSNEINVNAEAKEQGRDMQTLVDDSGVFYRDIEKRASFPLVLVGAPRKGQALSLITSWIAPGLPHMQVGLWCAFWQASPGPLPAVFTIKLLAEPSWALFPLVHGGGHTTNAVGVVLQDYKPRRVQ